MLAAVIGDGLPTGRDTSIIIDDQVAASGQLRVKVIQGVHRRFVHVAIQASHRQPFDGGGRQRVAEPTFQENDLFVEQAIAPKLSRTRASGIASSSNMCKLSSVSWG